MNTINKIESPQAYTFMLEMKEDENGKYSKEDFESLLDAFSKLEKEYSRLEARGNAFAKEREILAWNEKGYAVRIYDISTDSTVWRFAGTNIADNPAISDAMMELWKSDKQSPYKVIGNACLCDMKWLRENMDKKTDSQIMNEKIVEDLRKELAESTAEVVCPKS